MPTLTLTDGSTLTWDDAAPPYASPANDDADLPQTPVAAAPPALQSGAGNEGQPPVEADVKAALAATPPKWTATLRRFGKVLLAAVVATLGAYQGDFNALVHDPRAAIALAGTAILAAGEKFVRWKE